MLDPGDKRRDDSVPRTYAAASSAGPLPAVPMMRSISKDEVAARLLHGVDQLLARVPQAAVRLLLLAVELQHAPGLRLDLVDQLPAVLGGDEGVERHRLLLAAFLADAQLVHAHDLVAQHLHDRHHARGLRDDDAVLVVHLRLVLGEPVARQDGVVGRLRDLVGAQLDDELVLPGVAVLGVVDDLAAHLAVVHHLVDHVGAVDALAHAGDAVALEGGFQLLEQVDLGAFAQLVGGLALELALHVGELRGQLQHLGLLGQDGAVLLPLQVLLLALHGLQRLGHALLHRRLLLRLQRRHLLPGGGPRLLAWASLAWKSASVAVMPPSAACRSSARASATFCCGRGRRLGPRLHQRRLVPARAAGPRSCGRCPGRWAARTWGSGRRGCAAGTPGGSTAGTSPSIPSLETAASDGERKGALPKSLAHKVIWNVCAYYVLFMFQAQLKIPARPQAAGFRQAVVA